MDLLEDTTTTTSIVKLLQLQLQLQLKVTFTATGTAAAAAATVVVDPIYCKCRLRPLESITIPLQTPRHCLPPPREVNVLHRPKRKMLIFLFGRCNICIYIYNVKHSTKVLVLQCTYKNNTIIHYKLLVLLIHVRLTLSTISWFFCTILTIRFTHLFV